MNPFEESATTITDDEALTLALFCSHEMIAPEDVRLQCSGRFYDGRELVEEDKQRIIRAMLER
jgi:hypothetical protein